VDRLGAAARSYDEALAAALAGAVPPPRLDEANGVLLRAERALTRAEGLPGRPWYRHHVYAPGFYTGYGVKTLPGVREALEQREWPRAAEQVRLAAVVLEAYAGEVERAAALLGP
jgi:N-acetylated-alpha-linked acidic dipeptidase